MTFAEILRRMESYKRKMESRMKEQAEFHYILADLIGISIARILDKDVKYPSIDKVYPKLFKKSEEQIEKEKTDISVARFMQFANAHNAKFEQQEGNNGKSNG